VLFFLAESYRATKERWLYDAVLSLATALSAAVRDAELPVGWMSGSAGMGFSLVVTGRVLERADVEAVGEDVILRGAVPAGRNGELYSGTAGIILLLLELNYRTGADSYLRQAQILADHLLYSCLVPQVSGFSLASTEDTAIPLVGAAHGASGPALAFLALNAVRPSFEYSYAARSLLEYEDSIPDSSGEAWADGRLMPGFFRLERARLSSACRAGQLGRFDRLASVHPIAWCGGRSGLLAARIVAWRQGRRVPGDEAPLPRWQGDPLWAADLGRVEDLTYCCGLAGRIEVGLLAGEMSGNTAFIEDARKLACHALHMELEEGGLLRPWQLSEGRPFLGFLRGLAGLGYLLLRLEYPADYSLGMMPGVRAAAPLASGRFQRSRSDAGSDLREALPRRYWSFSLNVLTRLRGEDPLRRLLPSEAHSAADDNRAVAISLQQEIESLGRHSCREVLDLVHDIERYRYEFELTRPIRLSLRIADELVGISLPGELSDDRRVMPAAELRTASFGAVCLVFFVVAGEGRLSKVREPAASILRSLVSRRSRAMRVGDLRAANPRISRADSYAALRSLLELRMIRFDREERPELPDVPVAK
jgi:hypothetical protein